MSRRQLVPYATPRLERNGERHGERAVSAEVSLEDFAFADTVMVPDLLLRPVACTATERQAAPVSQLRSAWDEMNFLWEATAEHDPRAPLGRRLRTFFSFFEWQRDDILRAAWIGFAMLVLLATVAAVALRPLAR